MAILCRHECFTGKDTTRKIHKNYIRDPEWFIFHNLTREFIDDVISVISPIILSMSFCLCNKKNITRRLEDMNFIFWWQKTIFYSLAALVHKILFCHSKIKFISSRRRVISSMYVKLKK